MEGEGSVQVNNWRRKNLQYRLVIKIKNTAANLAMLQELARRIGGRAVESKDNAL